MAGVEFLDPGAPGSEPDADAHGDSSEPSDPAGQELTASPGTLAEPPWVSPTVALLWLAAAAACVVAAFRRVYTVRVPGPAEFVTTVDGWGDFHDSARIGGTHGTRIGIVLCVVAAAFVGCAALRTARRSVGRARRWSVAAGGAAVAALAGTTATTGLGVQSTFDNVRHSLALQAADFADPTPGLDAARYVVGGAVWWSIAALIAGLMALVLPNAVRSRPARRRTAPGTEQHAKRDPNDETLPKQTGGVHDRVRGVTLRRSGKNFRQERNRSSDTDES